MEKPEEEVVDELTVALSKVFDERLDEWLREIAKAILINPEAECYMSVKMETEFADQEKGVWLDVIYGDSRHTVGAIWTTKAKKANN